MTRTSRMKLTKLQPSNLLRSGCARKMLVIGVFLARQTCSSSNLEFKMMEVSSHNGPWDPSTYQGLGLPSSAQTLPLPTTLVTSFARMNNCSFRARFSCNRLSKSSRLALAVSASTSSLRWLSLFYSWSSLKQARRCRSSRQSKNSSFISAFYWLPISYSSFSDRVRRLSRIKMATNQWLSASDACHALSLPIAVFLCFCTWHKWHGSSMETIFTSTSMQRTTWARQMTVKRQPAHQSRQQMARLSNLEASASRRLIPRNGST